MERGLQLGGIGGCGKGGIMMVFARVRMDKKKGKDNGGGGL